jgi:hypothetical protein
VIVSYASSSKGCGNGLVCHSHRAPSSSRSRAKGAAGAWLERRHRRLRRAVTREFGSAPRDIVARHLTVSVPTSRPCCHRVMSRAQSTGAARSAVHGQSTQSTANRSIRISDLMWELLECLRTGEGRAYDLACHGRLVICEWPARCAVRSAVRHLLIPSDSERLLPTCLCSCRLPKLIRWDQFFPGTK